MSLEPLVSMMPNSRSLDVSENEVQRGAGVAKAVEADPMLQTRTEVVWPSMCGHNSLLVGRIGDWTWDAVGAACKIDVLNARDSWGRPAYLSFCYYRIRGSRRFHLRTPTFGDRLHVGTALYRTGGYSVLALHRIGRSALPPAVGFTLPDFSAAADDDCLHVETLNRWITRSDGDSNQGLLKAVPPDFTLEGVPEIPPSHGLLHARRRARTSGTLRPLPLENMVSVGHDLLVDYEVDPSRDLNGVGLLYFAAYFSIVDWALLRWWRHQGRGDAQFLNRIVVDQQVCYLANADAGTMITASVRASVTGSRPNCEFVDVVLRDGTRTLVVCTLELLKANSA